jgi:ABC-type multidrug transport system ATPase subunit
MYNVLLEYLKNTTNFGPEFRYFTYLSILKSFSKIIKDVLLINLIINFSINSALLLFCLSHCIFSLFDYISYKYARYAQSVYVSDQINKCNDILQNMDLDKLHKYDKNMLNATLHDSMFICIRIFEMLDYGIGLFTFIFVLLIICLLNFNFSLLVSLCLLIFLIFYLNNLSERICKKFLDELNVARYLMFKKLSDHCTNIFNIAINNNTSSNDALNKTVELYYSKENTYTAITTFFILLINCVSIISFTLYYMLFGSDITVLFIIKSINFIFVCIIDILWVQEKLSFMFTYIVGINNIYKIKPRTKYRQIQLEDSDKIIIDILRIKKDYCNAELSNQITLNPSDTVLIEGVSGAGKTTLVKVFRNIIELPDDDVILKIENEKTKTTKDIPKGFKSISSNIYYVDQQFTINGVGSIFELITGCTEEDLDKENKQYVIDLLKTTELDFLLEKKTIDTKTLSGGQSHRLSICATLYINKIQYYNIVIMDEVDTGLDNKISEKIFQFIKSNNTDRIILYISHNQHLKKLKPKANRIKIYKEDDKSIIKYIDKSRKIDKI